MSTRYLKLGLNQNPFYDDIMGIKIDIGEIIEVPMNMTSSRVETGLVNGHIVAATYDEYINGPNYQNTPTSFEGNSPTILGKSFNKEFFNKSFR